jgi:hypothetical protein
VCEVEGVLGENLQLQLQKYICGRSTCDTPGASFFGFYVVLGYAILLAEDIL